jgi:DNA repair protein RadC
VISVGTLNSSLVHPREVFKSAIKESANAIILVHNHQSSNCSPSGEDELISEKLIEVGNLMQIKVLDHIVVAGDGYHSLVHNN